MEISVGDDHGVDPDALITALEKAKAYLRALDLATSNLGHQRMKWRVVKARLNSPMVTEWEADVAIAGVKEPNLIQDHQRLADSLSSGRDLPDFANSDVLKSLKGFLSVGLNGGGYASIGAPGLDALVANPDIAAKLTVYIEESERSPYKLFTSVEGVVRQITNDTRPKQEKFSFQIIDRVTQAIVKCYADENIVRAIDGHTTGRVTVYGNVEFAQDGKPKDVRVESCRLMESDESLPSIDDIHALGADITGDLDSEDYIRGLRNAE